MSKLLRKITVFLACGTWAVPLPAQPTSEPSHVMITNALISIPIPPAPPPLKSPVELFRDLLAMTPAERNKFLEGRSAENRKLILEKIREYQAMTPEQRELRLTVTELRWYLLPLLKTEATNRNQRLASMPVEMRKLVEDRLRIWEIMPPPFQKEVLQNESLARLFSDIAAGAVVWTNSSPEARTNLAKWLSIPEDKRREISQSFLTFFGLTSYEQEKVLRRLSPQERHQIEKTLETYNGLTPAQRARCIRSFKQFSDFTSEERKDFLKKAQEWEKIPPSARQSFRKVVDEVSMLPPFVVMRPPMPPVTRPSRGFETVTNN
jgi:hypothetical protein